MKRIEPSFGEISDVETSESHYVIFEETLEDDTNKGEMTGSNANANRMLSCVSCGKIISTLAASCPNCGAPRRTSRYKNKNVTALFALFLGHLGGHRFYLGQWWGIFYLLLFWTGVPALIAFIEFLYFLLRSLKKWDHKYNDGIPAGLNDGSNIVVITILVLFGFFISIAIIGIIAAVVLPAYQSYTLRTNV